MLAIRDTMARWDTVVVAVGREEPAIATALVDRLESCPNTASNARARLLLEDGVRLASVDTVRAEARLRQAAEVDSVGISGERARLRLIRLSLTRATSAAELAPIAKELDRRIEGRGELAGDASQLRESVGHILAAADSASAGAAQADLRLFLAAETARDSLGAPALAASLFRTIVEAMPESPYAPKAILAGQALDPVWGASAVPLLEERYAASPYVAFLQGAEPYGYRELEDSLQNFALGAGAPATVRRPVNREDTLRTRPGAEPRPRRGLEP
jgi:hypothetical protein